MYMLRVSGIGNTLDLIARTDFTWSDNYYYHITVLIYIYRNLKGVFAFQVTSTSGIYSRQKCVQMFFFREILQQI